MPIPGEPTYKMRFEPAAYKFSGGEVSFRIRTPFEPMLERTLAEIEKRRGLSAEDRETVERQRHHLDRALEALRGIDDEARREALMDGLGAALALGFFHHGGPGAVAETEAAARRAGTLNGRATWADTPKMQVAAQVKSITEELTFPLWDADREYQGKYEFRGRHEHTADRIFDEFSERVRTITGPESKWFPPILGDGALYESYRKRMVNPIRAAYKKYMAARSV